MSNATSFDFIDSRFRHQRIKVPIVVFQDHMQAIGDLVIPAPAGVVLDPLTGLLNVTVTPQLAGVPQLRDVSVLPNKVISQGIVPAQLVVNGLVVIQSLEIPFQGVVDALGVAPGDIVQHHDVQIEGFSIASVQVPGVGGVGLILNLILKVALEMCLVVARERIIKVNAAETFC